MHWEGETTTVSSWQSRSWKSWRVLWMASSDSWCQSKIPSLASSQPNAQQIQSLQETYLAANKRLYMAFIHLKKVSDQVPRKVIWWALRKRCGGVDCVSGAGDVCQCMEPCPCWWGVQWRVWRIIGVNQDSILSLLFFIIVLEALLR